MNPTSIDGSLYEAFAQVPDPRHRRGTIYPLPAVLTLVATAMLCGCRSLAAIAQWGRDYNHLVPRLGFSRRALDGKTLRGSQGHQLPGVHLLAAYCRDVEAVIAQIAVPGKTNEHKTALELLKLIPLKGTLITGDAALTQRDLCETVVQGEGDYFLTVKGNQPTLEGDIRAAFGPAFSPSGGTAAGGRG